MVATRTNDLDPARHSSGGGVIPNDSDNCRVWDGRKRGHYEVWYMTLNHVESGTGYWIRYTMESPLHADAYAQLWFAHFDAKDPSRTFALNKKFPIAEMHAERDPFAVTIGDARLTGDSALGRIDGDGHEASWDLTWRPGGVTHRQLPKIMYSGGGRGGTTVLTPNINVPFSGVIEVDGRRYELSGDPGGQTHLWGKKHAHAWAWGHCNAFEGRPDASLESLTAVLKRRGRVLPAMTVFCLYLDGEAHRFGSFRDVLLTRGDFDTARYRFRGSGSRVRIEGEYSCRAEDMVVAGYHDPDGEASYCSNTEIADLRVTVYKRSGLLDRWQEHARLVAPATGHFEVGSRDRDPAIAKNHVTVTDEPGVLD